MSAVNAWLSESWWAGVQGITSVIGLLSIVALLADYFAKKRRISKPNIEVWYLGNSQDIHRNHQYETEETQNQTQKGVLNIENTGGSAVTIVLLAFLKCSILDFEDEIPTSVLLPGDHLTIGVSKIDEKSKATIGWIAHNDSRMVVLRTMKIMTRGSRLLVPSLSLFERAKLHIQHKWWYSEKNSNDIGEEGGETYVRTHKRDFLTNLDSINKALETKKYNRYFALDSQAIMKQ